MGRLTRFSANLGFLWADLALPDAIRAAARAGFDAVECHWPYEVPAEDVKAALDETGLPMLSLNTRRGDVAAGENGLAALPDREEEARAAIDEALDYAAATGTGKVHVMAGFADSSTARDTFVRNLRYACTQAAPLGITILIEPLNSHDVPGYFLTRTDQACGIIEDVGAPNLKLMFDCYHVEIMEGDLCARFTAMHPLISHIQFADAPGRGAPGTGEIDYQTVFRHIRDAGFAAPLGAEYKPRGPTEPTLEWMSRLRGQRTQGS